MSIAAAPWQTVRRVLRYVLPSSDQPAQLVVAGFALVILAGTVLLMLPVAGQSGGGTGLVTALFTATTRFV